jgi:hypothetical protein
VHRSPRLRRMLRRSRRRPRRFLRAAHSPTGRCRMPGSITWFFSAQEVDGKHLFMRSCAGPWTNSEENREWTLHLSNQGCRASSSTHRAV